MQRGALRVLDSSRSNVFFSSKLGIITYEVLQALVHALHCCFMKAASKFRSLECMKAFRETQSSWIQLRCNCPDKSTLDGKIPLAELFIIIVFVCNYLIREFISAINSLERPN